MQRDYEYTEEMIKQITRKSHYTAGKDSLEWHLYETEMFFVHTQKKVHR